MENMVRRSWTGAPSPFLRAVSVAYGMGADLRNVAWTVGLAAPLRESVPIISIGGISIGGRGKAPVTASLARHLADSGSKVSILIADIADEKAVHATQNPDVPVFSGRDRGRLAGLAIHQGATVLLLDSGFQHRRLQRDLDILVISADYMGNRERLPAGPYRERWAEIGRADRIILTRRRAPSEAMDHLTAELSNAFPGVPIAEARIAPVSIAPVSEAAHRIDVPLPELAVAGVMWPGAVFAAVIELGLHPEHRLTMSDHAEFDQMTVARIVDLAGSGGVVCTGKDSVKLTGSLPESVPIWRIVEDVEWASGGSDLLHAATQVARMGANRRAAS